MDYLDKIAGTVTTVSKAVSSKAKEVADVASLRHQITMHDETIRKAYYELGKLYYQEHRRDPEAECVELCARITDAMAEKVILEDKIKERKDQ